MIAAYNGTDVILRSENISDTSRLLVRVVDISATADDQLATVTAISLQVGKLHAHQELAVWLQPCLRSVLCTSGGARILK